LGWSNKKQFLNIHNAWPSTKNNFVVAVKIREGEHLKLKKRIYKNIFLVDIRGESVWRPNFVFVGGGDRQMLLAITKPHFFERL